LFHCKSNCSSIFGADLSVEVLARSIGLLVAESDRLESGQIGWVRSTSIPSAKASWCVCGRIDRMEIVVKGKSDRLLGVVGQGKGDRLFSVFRGQLI
ncbi:MAG: hypothetical protein VKJ24_05320, partial [Synechococcales bacterium]|nr:hypothetical protein [Synechococcales bacterium]